MSDEPESKEERKMKRLKAQYDFELPPPEVVVKFATEGADVDRYVLKRPSIGDRNKLMKDLGAFSGKTTSDVDPQMWVRTIHLCLKEPKLSAEGVGELDAYKADMLFKVAQEILFTSVLNQETKNP